jgi:hypothetical protein
MGRRGVLSDPLAFPISKVAFSGYNGGKWDHDVRKRLKP